MNELTRASQWLYTQLGSLGAPIYDGIAPIGTASPYVIVQVQSPGADVNTANGYRVWATPLFLVKAIDKTRSWSSLAALADQIDTRLQRATGTTSDGRVLSCIREMPFSLIEENNGDQFRHLGGFFRIQIQPLGA